MTQTSQPHKDTRTELFRALRQEGTWGSGKPRRMAGSRRGYQQGAGAPSARRAGGAVGEPWKRNDGLRWALESSLQPRSGERVPKRGGHCDVWSYRVQARVGTWRGQMGDSGRASRWSSVLPSGWIRGCLVPRKADSRPRPRPYRSFTAISSLSKSPAAAVHWGFPHGYLIHQLIVLKTTYNTMKAVAPRLVGLTRPCPSVRKPHT